MLRHRSRPRIHGHRARGRDRHPDPEGESFVIVIVTGEHEFSAGVGRMLQKSRISAAAPSGPEVKSG